jgi:hypothetical protein
VVSLTAIAGLVWVVNIEGRERVSSEDAGELFGQARVADVIPKAKQRSAPIKEIFKVTPFWGEMAHELPHSLN